MRKLVLSSFILLSYFNILGQGNVSDSIELAALTAFYESTNGGNEQDDTWSGTNWLNGTTANDFATWEGITVTNGDVTKIILFNKNLSGNIPIEIGNLTELTHLKISQNDIEGSIPDEIGNLDKMTNLILDRNDLTGSIPATIGDMSSLKYLFLWGNALTGPIPSAIGNASLLKDIRINQNQLSGSLPASLGDLEDLEVFYLHYNNLSGSWPIELEGLDKMKYMYASHNNFTGTIPSILSWTIAKQVRFDNNQFTSMPDLSGFTGTVLQHIFIQNNLLKYHDIEPNMASGSNIKTQIENYYYPQYNEEVVEYEFYYPIQNSVQISVDTDGSNTQYHWERKVDGTWEDVTGVDFTETNNQLTISNLDETHAGLYRCSLTNTLLTDLDLESETIQLTIDLAALIDNDPIAISIPNPVSSPEIPTAPTGDIAVNYIRTYSYRDSLENVLMDLDTLSPELVQVSTNYIDGLGRSVQNVIKQESPFYEDIVQIIDYDSAGRQPKEFLPYTHCNTGDYKTQGRLYQYNFYDPDNQNPPYADHAKTKFAYSETTFENNLLNRPAAINAPGESWEKGTNNGIKSEYKLNDLSVGTVQIWDLNGGLSSVGIYSTGELYMNVTIDEHENKVKEFKDKLGQVILKEVYEGIDVDDEDEDGDTSELIWLKTYYVYDDFQNLRYVIPPQATFLLENSSWNVTSDLINDWMFEYKYDDRQRMIYKKVPGANPVLMIYDERDRLRLTQDGEQWSNDEYTFTKYDVFNRPILTGIVTIPGDSIQVIDSVRTDTVFYETDTTIVHGYSNGMYPYVSDESKYLTVAYYDNYAFNTDSDLNFVIDDVGNLKHNTKVKGQLTGGKIRIGDSNQWIRTVTYYDDRFRIIQTISDNHKGGLERLSTKYDFQGLQLESLITHSLDGNDETQILRKFEYDHTGRLLTINHKLDSLETVIIASNTYNSVGELKTKEIHSTDEQNFLQEIDYSYNIRGWLTGINDAQLSDANDLFGMELFYDYGFEHAQFNGNISGVRWKTKGDDHTKAYGYTYDPVNRLTGGDYVAGTTGSWNQEDNWYSVQNLNYDKNGNIEGLERFTPVDNVRRGMDYLVYTYDGNQLINVNDAMLDDEGFKEKSTGSGVEYLYDLNGNMTRDDNKGITDIDYNHLNLPIKVTKDDGKYITYLYDAAGIKLSQKVYDEYDQLQKVTDYIGEFIYEDSSLSFLQHEEGRVVLNKEYNFYNAEFDQEYIYQYYLKDYLGNVRMTIQDWDTVEYLATMEKVWGATRMKEDSLFQKIYWTADSLFPALNHTPIDSAITPNPEYTAYLDGYESIIGPSRMIHVLAGDEIEMESYVYYRDDGNNYTEVVPFGTIASLLASSFSATVPGEQSAEIVQGFDLLTAADHPWSSNPDPFNGKPRAFLNFILFDKDHNFIDMGAEELSAAGEYTNPATPGTAGYLTLTKSIDKEGYIYIFLSNETPNTDVYFDDLKITHIKSPIVQKDDYYPFGLTFNKSLRTANFEQQLKFGGKEEQDELGLGWLDFRWRNYGPAIGRWMNVDNKAELAYQLTPYRFSFNNPVLFTDPDGQWEIEARTTGKGKKSKTTLHIVKTRDDDDFNSFVSDLGFEDLNDETLGIIENMFGEEIQSQIASGEVAVDDLSGSGGKKLKSFQKAISNYNKKASKYIGTNCMDCNVGVDRNNVVPLPNTATISFQSQIPFLKDSFYESVLDSEYDNLSSDKARFGDTIRYANEGAEQETAHVSIFLFNNNKGVQVFEKPDGSSKFNIAYETKNLKENRRGHKQISKPIYRYKKR